MVFKLDIIDEKILAELIQNGRISAKKLAKKVNVHSNTLLQRMKRLEKRGIIKKYSAQVDYAKIGYDLHAIMSIKVRKGHPGDAKQLKDLLDIKEIQSLYATTGIWDLVCTVRVRDRQHLLDILQKIGNNKIVTKSSTQIVLFSYKTPYEFNPLK